MTMSDRRINFMSQASPFTGYLYHKAETDYAALWKTFIDSGRENWEYRNSYGDGTQGVNERWVALEVELELQRKIDSI